MDTESEGQRQTDRPKQRPTDRQASQTDPQPTSNKTGTNPASKRKVYRQTQTNEQADRQKKQASRLTHEQ